MRTAFFVSLTVIVFLFGVAVGQERNSSSKAKELEDLGMEITIGDRDEFHEVTK